MSELQHIRSKAMKGSIWAIVEKFSLQIVQFIVGVILARLLEPRDYGLIAITTIFTSISGAITDGGFEKTLIRKEILLPVEINSVFYINILLGGLMMTGLFWASPSLAVFFNEPSLSPVLRVVSIGLVLNAAGQTQKALLMKELHFKKISIAQIFSSLIGGVTGVVMAYGGFGVWALVYSALVAQLVSVLFFWVRSDWYPRLNFSFAAIKEMLPYGSRILLTSLLFFLMLQFNNFVIGKFYSKTSLGFFNRGSRLPELIISIIQSIVLKMVFPLFAKVQQDNLQFIKVVRKTTKIVGFISIPLLTLLLVNAQDITLVLFTAKWSGSIIFLEFFCLIRLFEPFIAIHREMILAKGHARLLLRFFVISSLVEIGLVLYAATLGIMYVVLATLVCKLGQFISYLLITSAELKVSWQKQLSWIIPYFLISIFMALSVVLMHLLFLASGMSILLSLSLRMSFGMGVYFMLSWWFKLEELVVIKDVLQAIEKKFIFVLKKGKLAYRRP